MNPKYEKILHAEHHYSSRRKLMSLYDRAAQFAPFAALTGHGAAIQETARLTEEEIELSPEETEELNRKFLYLQNHLDSAGEVTITHFVYDRYKYGGKYVDTRIKIRTIDLTRRLLVTTEKKTYDIDLIIDIDCDLFHDVFD